jgi:hypothetical protein
MAIMHKYSYPKKPWTNFSSKNGSNFATRDAVDLLSKMLVVDHNERIGT